MGGLGSGNWWSRWDAKPLVEDCEALDVNWLHRHGWFERRRTGQLTWTMERRTTAEIGVTASPSQVTLFYWYKGVFDAEWEPVESVVRLTWTPCHFGGRRPWFVCPGCGRRVAKLYLRGKYFLCRRCHNLAYKSQREDRAERLMRKADKIRMRLGGKPGMLNPFPPKPQGMHWLTYLGLWEETTRLEMEALVELHEEINRLEEGVAKLLSKKENSPDPQGHRWPGLLVGKCCAAGGPQP